MAKKESKLGRPTKYKPEYCEQIVELGKQGYSKARMACAFEVARSTLDDWAAEHKEFYDSITRAREESLAFYEAKAAEGLDAMGFNSALWGKLMGGMFPDDYSDRKKLEVTGNNGEPVQTVNVTKVILAPLTKE